MKINYKNYIINIEDIKSASKKELNCTIYDAMKKIDRITKRNNKIKDKEKPNTKQLPLIFNEVIPWLKNQIKKANAPKMSVVSYFNHDSFENDIETRLIKNNQLIIGYWDHTYGKLIKVAKIIINDRYETLQDLLDSIDDGSINITEIKQDSVKDSTFEYYKGYIINPYTKLHDEDCDCKYEITKDGIIVEGANSIEEAKEKIDNLVEKNTTYTKDASVIIDFSDFKPWSGAINTWEKIIEEDKLDDFERMIDELYPDGIGETELNDWLWFDSKQLLEDLGINDSEYDEDSEFDEDDELIEDKKY